MLVNSHPEDLQVADPKEIGQLIPWKPQGGDPAILDSSLISTIYVVHQWVTTYSVYHDSPVHVINKKTIIYIELHHFTINNPSYILHYMCTNGYIPFETSPHLAAPASSHPLAAPHGVPLVPPGNHLRDVSLENDTWKSFKNWENQWISMTI